jgi:uncharacterized protein (TIGR03435 family)
MTGNDLVKIVLAAGIAVVLNAQEPSFEVASIKLNKTGSPQSVPPIQPGRLTLTGRTLRSLVQFAYSPVESPLRESQILGGPEWADSERFDILAKMQGNPAPGRANAELARLSLRTLLKERFRLELQNESREMPVYGLTLARADGRLGAGLRRRPDLDCEGFIPRPELPDLKADAALCGYLRGGRGTLNYRGVTMSRLASGLATDRIVTDRTGMAGLFDVDLTWAFQADASSDAPSIFTAVQEQLGLKLQPMRAPVDVIVIVRAEMPAPD